MDNWHPIIFDQLVLARHREDLARGEAERRLTALSGPRPVRARLAAALAALAARLDPARHAPRRDVATFTPGTPA
jgi:hypothetical protein